MAFAGTTGTFPDAITACANKTCGRAYYRPTALPIFVVGQVVYDDATLTVPFNGGGNWVAIDTSMVYCSGAGWNAIQIDANGVILANSPCPSPSTTTTTTTTTEPPTTTTTTTTTTINAQAWNVRTENDVVPTQICTNPIITVYSAIGDSFTTFTKLYTDAGLTTGFTIAGANTPYILDVLTGTIFVYNNGLSEIGADSGQTCTPEPTTTTTQAP
jgi:hypothetical protein